MYFGYLNQLLKMMVTVKQIEQMNQLCNNSQRDYHREVSESTETDEIRVSDKTNKLVEAYRAYGEYCSLFGLTPSEEGFETWYNNNILD
jgi:intergrase/recombinase